MSWLMKTFFKENVLVEVPRIYLGDIYAIFGRYNELFLNLPVQSDVHLFQQSILGQNNSVDKFDKLELGEMKV